MSRNKLPPVMGESSRCNDEEAYKHVAIRKPFNGNVFRAQWRSDDHSCDERYVVSAWDISRQENRAGKTFTPILIWEGHNGYGLWYGVDGENAWICNALTADLMMEGEMIYPLTPKDMLAMRDYGIGGVAAAMAVGTGIEEGEQTGIYALDNDEGEKK